MKKSAEKRQYYIHLVECRNVPTDDCEVMLKWKRGKKQINKGVLKQLNCINGIVKGNQFGVIMPQCTLFRNSNGYEEKLIKLSLTKFKDDKKKKQNVIGYCYINLAEYVDFSTRQNVTFPMKSKKGKSFECEIDIQCLGGVEVSEADKTEIFSTSKSTNPFGEESDEEISDEVPNPKKKSKELDKNNKSTSTLGKSRMPQKQVNSNNPFDDTGLPKKNLNNKKSMGSQSMIITSSNNPFSENSSDSSEHQPTTISQTNPFDDDVSDEATKVDHQATTTLDKVNTNPFDDDNDFVDNNSKTSVVVTESSVTAQKTTNTNPFSDSSESDDSKQQREESLSVSIKVPTTNPFSDDSEDEKQKTQNVTEVNQSNPFVDESDEKLEEQVEEHRNPFGDESEVITHVQCKESHSCSEKSDGAVEVTEGTNPFGEDNSDIILEEEPNQIETDLKVDSEDEINSSEDLDGNIFVSTRTKQDSPEVNLIKPKEELVPIIQYKKNSGTIDLREVFDSVNSLKGNLDDLDSFIILMKKWWCDGQPHIELNVLPMIMDDYKQCVWLLIGIKDLGGKIRKSGTKMSQRDIQINEIYESTFVRAVKLISARIEGILDYLISVTMFDSKRSTFEEGVANGTAEIMNDIFESVSKNDQSISDRLLKQICHFICYYIIEEMLQRNKINGMKGFQMNYFVSCIQSQVFKKYTPLKKYMKCLDPLLEFCRLLTMPMSLEIIQMKDEVFPSLPVSLISKTLHSFRLDSYNLNRVPQRVFDYLFEHPDGKNILSRYDILK
ncbi:hypothetical protein EDI_043450 [Entamoeba dispar SAW760]|uniref:C2 NT-type domain-containing protein n=1 Tax=Entamoeba dispar (strain ATCC PRA-260 / SAW760) TaxID=370354 RepID=B0ESE3_ENTDS|nr:uncharacterized protein EDI_043450 [Entamoeba dispar SAW760]EDR22567.1 hypothetical protein EDI_043450 [Entamoeba dispar SAW760]|eukprot:EDR22567.1 hypothetical protein EDI_043450 [Entamoeba dispar SAW760]